MLVPSLSESSSDILIAPHHHHHHHHDDLKNPTHSYVYYKQPYSLQIIQLVECPAPPPREDISAVSSSSSGYDSSECTEEEEEEEICSSYCSSDLPPEEFEDPIVNQSTAPEISDVRMKRVLAWRENFSSAMSAALSDSTPLKRKYPGDHCEEDTMSHSSKRSRLSDDSIREHSCPACDATFPTPQSLRQHGLLDAAKSNEACSVAVQYAFE